MLHGPAIREVSKAYVKGMVIRVDVCERRDYGIGICDIQLGSDVTMKVTKPEAIQAAEHLFRLAIARE